jgi:hypothetical protein
LAPSSKSSAAGGSIGLDGGVTLLVCFDGFDETGVFSLATVTEAALSGVVLLVDQGSWRDGFVGVANTASSNSILATSPEDDGITISTLLPLGNIRSNTKLSQYEPSSKSIRSSFTDVTLADANSSCFFLGDDRLDGGTLAVC